MNEFCYHMHVSCNGNRNHVKSALCIGRIRWSKTSAAVDNRAMMGEDKISIQQKVMGRRRGSRKRRESNMRTKSDGIWTQKDGWMERALISHPQR